MEIMPNRMDRGFFRYQDEFETASLNVLRSGWYVLGEQVEAFEREFAAYLGANHCVGLASGLDSLWIAFRLLGMGPGDEVIVQGNTYIASVMGITINGATPVFVEPDDHFGIDPIAIERAITPRTRAVLVTHLYGMASRMDEIVDICRRYDLRLIEDCAQSHGARFDGQATGTFGDVGCFSFYPSKNLGAFGDAGAVIVRDAGLADDFRVFRNYGSEKRYHNKVVGANSRLDELQAALLRVRLAHLDELNIERVQLAHCYTDRLDNPLVNLPELAPGAEGVWHQYVVRCSNRDGLVAHLAERGVGTLVHYPIPPHLSEAYAHLGYELGSFPVTEQLASEVLSLPMYNGMTAEEQDYVIQAINDFR